MTEYVAAPLVDSRPDPAPSTPDRRRGWGDNPWLRFVVRRLGRLLVSVWVLVTLAFAMIHLVPGDPVRAALGPSAPAELVEARRAALGLDAPLWRQYLDYLGGLLTGDLGASILNGRPVADLLSQSLPATLEIALLAFVFTIVVAIPLGTVMAVLTRGGRGRRTELAFTSTTVVVGAIPEFLLAVGLVYLFAVKLDLLPIATRGGIDSYVLPVIALGLAPALVMARILRVEMLTVLGQDYIRTARAKRLPFWRVALQHALPNALTAVLTLAGLLVSGMVAGTVLVETVFAWPGLGSSIVESILAKDYPVVQAIVLVYGVGVLLVNLLVDVALVLIDPRNTIREA